MHLHVFSFGYEFSSLYHCQMACHLPFYCTRTKVLGNGSLICFQLGELYTHTHTTCTLYPNHVANIIDDQGTNNSLPLQNNYKDYVV